MNYQKEDVRRAIKGDENSFIALYSSIQLDLYRFAYYQIGSREEAEDAVSETVLSAYHGIRRLKSPDNFQNWILKILSVQCKEKIRGLLRKREFTHLEDSDVVESLEKNYEMQEDMDMSLDLRNALMQLSQDDREIVILSAILGYSSQEIGGWKQMNPHTTRTRLSRALKQLRSLIEA